MRTPQLLFHRRVRRLAWIVCLLGLLTTSACTFPTPLTADIGMAAPPEYSTPQVCNSSPGYSTGSHNSDRTVDLDPSVPQDGKSGLVVLMRGGEVVYIYFSTQTQLDAYLVEISEPFCVLTEIPPACPVGHYPGEPPGRPTCTALTVTFQAVASAATTVETPSAILLPPSPTATLIQLTRTPTPTSTPTSSPSPNSTMTPSPSPTAWSTYPPPSSPTSVYPQTDEE